MDYFLRISPVAPQIFCCKRPLLKLKPLFIVLSKKYLACVFCFAVSKNFSFISIPGKNVEFFCINLLRLYKGAVFVLDRTFQIETGAMKSLISFRRINHIIQVSRSFVPAWSHHTTHQPYPWQDQHGWSSRLVMSGHASWSPSRWFGFFSVAGLPLLMGFNGPLELRPSDFHISPKSVKVELYTLRRVMLPPL